MKLKKMLLLGGLLIVGAVAVVGLSGCSDDEPTEEEAVAALCSDLTALDTALGAYADLTVNSTFDDVEAAQEGVTDAFEAVKSSAADVADARVDDLESAYDSLVAAVDAVSGEDTISGAATTLEEQAQAVQDARQDLTDSVSCS